MKKSFVFVLCSLSMAMLVFFSGCKSETAPVPESFMSNKECPAWEAVENPDLTSSMTAVVKVDLKAQYPNEASDFVLKDSDQVAAFIGETCVYTCAPLNGLFFLYINATEGDVTIRYYSAYYKNLFEAKNAFPFTNDAHPGTVAAPFIPAFVVMK